jgi:SAM-dependent methyltransferase
MSVYSNDFYTNMEQGSQTSAEQIVPLLLSKYLPKSVVDVGCGTGPFANEFLKLGVSDVAGYEGDWMKPLPTILPKNFYLYQDLTEDLNPTRVYDLCLCLEVAEHLEESSARTLIDTITRLSNVVVFSAAIPQQGGNHHVNEQWPFYWSNLFEERGYYLEWDPRPVIWENSQIEGCYRQNLLVFSSNAGSRQLKPVSLVHPVLWAEAMNVRQIPFSIRIARKLPKSVFRLRRSLRKLLRFKTHE